MEMLIVYTANFGGKDTVFPEAFVSNQIEYFYFTDLSGEIPNRTVVKEVSKFDDPIRTAKWYKLHSHVLFPGKTTLWLDANYGLSKTNNILDFAKNSEDIALQRHHQLPYDEANYCLSSGKVQHVKTFQRQIEFYREQGLPADAPLYRGGIVLRKPTATSVIFNTLWWDEINRWQLRDQLSLAYVLWKNNISVSYLPPKGYYGRRGNHDKHLLPLL